MQQDVIDAMMGFDPENMTVFQQKSTNATNPNIYKTNPKDSKSEDGNYRSKLRILYNPYSAKDSIVDQTTYAMRDENGFFMVNALPYDQGGRDNCPLFKAWKTVFFASSEFAAKFAAKMYPGASNAAKREALLQEFNSVQGYGKEANDKRFKGTELGKAIRQYSNENFDRVESSWVLVQVIEDINKPELVGSIKVMKLPRAIRAKLDGKMHPSKESGKKPVDLMSWVLGYPLEMEVKPGPDDPNAPERRQREISYDLCEFAQEFEPICKVDGTPLFNEEQIAILDEFATARSEAEKGKSEAKRKAAQAKIEIGSELYMKVRELVGVAYNYLKEAQIVDIVKECAYQEWDTATNSRVQKWIDTVTLANFNETSEQPVVPVSTVSSDEAYTPVYTPAEADVDPAADALPF
jgi:hypothetical protein